MLLVGLLPIAAAAGCADRPIAPTSSVGTRWHGNGHFYELRFCPGAPLAPCSWEDARDLARMIGPGWDLATITSAEEDAFVRSLFAASPAAFNIARTTLNNGPWIGARLEGPTVRDYVWVTGEPFVYANWGPNEPFGNGDRISYADWSSPFGDGAGLGWNDIGSGRTDGPISFLAELH
jgi:hypothetical protein